MGQLIAQLFLEVAKALIVVRAQVDHNPMKAGLAELPKELQLLQ